MKLSAGSLFKDGDDDITPSAIFKGGNSQNDITPSAVFKGEASQGNMGFPGSFGQDSMSSDSIPVSQNNRSQRPQESVAQESNDPFEILSDVGGKSKQKWTKRILSDSEDNDTDNVSDDEDNRRSKEEEEEDEEAEEAPSLFAGFRKKNAKGIRKEFVDEEASLSGSEVGSDENEDLAEEDDILELEEGDRDLAGVSAEALREQVCHTFIYM